MKLEIGDVDIDLSEVQMVGPLYGDPSSLRYAIYFRGGSAFDIYERRSDFPNMPRKEFIEKWRGPDDLEAPFNPAQSVRRESDLF